MTLYIEDNENATELNQMTFNSSIKEAKERGELSLARRMDAERRIASAIVRHALKNNMQVSINDGEEWTVKKSGNYREIMSALYSTDEDVIRLNNATDGFPLGKFFLVYGNDGYDVVSDYTVTETTDHIWETVIKPLSDLIEMGK